MDITALGCGRIGSVNDMKDEFHGDRSLCHGKQPV